MTILSQVNTRGSKLAPKIRNKTRKAMEELGSLMQEIVRTQALI